MSLAEISAHTPDPLPSTEKPTKPGISFGSYLPSEVLTNQQIASWGVKTDSGKILTPEAILKKTGIEKRYIANAEETPLFMAIKATEEALKGNKGNIDAVIVSTSFPTGENTSGKLQEKFGFSGFHIDVHAACSGIGLSLAYLKKYERQFTGKKILVVTTEKYSPHLQDLKEEEGSTKDPSLAQTLFSDGATACTFEYGKDFKILSVKRLTFPEGSESSIRMPINRKLLVPPFLEIPIPYPTSGKFEQDGNMVYELIRRGVPNLIRESVSAAGLTPTDIAKIFPHQGSKTVIEKGIIMQLPEYRDRILRDYENGNPSSGSATKGVMRAEKEGGIKKGDFINITVYGAGLCAISTTGQL